MHTVCQCLDLLAVIQASLETMASIQFDPDRGYKTAAEVVKTLMSEQYERISAYHERAHVHPVHPIYVTPS